MNDPTQIRSVAQELSDLEVAILLCRAAHGHCRIDTARDNISDVAKELALICSNTFNLSYNILDCSADTTFDEFCVELLPSIARRRSQSTKVAPELPIVDVVIATNFNYVDERIQLQALELMRSKKLVAQDGIYVAPERFVFLPLVATASSDAQPKLNRHLNDHLIISHYHDTEDGYVYLEDANGWISDDQISASSVVRKSDIPIPREHPLVDQAAVEKLEEAANAVIVNADLIRYHQDIVVFLRLSRAVAGGISSRSNILFMKLSKFLAALHGIDFLTPSIVALAAKKVFRHRIVVATTEDDRSLQYGSDPAVVAQILAHANPDTILESVLALEAPL
ncbi:hypothetical protein P168DRAFT_322542 [Aspergillus campestris IBT 28561]|uniref:magnesium chelatase n=1 Tax=Aspergillus campestris (strain IBT 28561) TaxID=1392248 RepID=A0A2I1CR49_ASPC2|nr:uncharacterized protein P168DRAFT_322542 [Aspergillus campestris IBT 28561]PKY00084.1 hypothetical protein P168DRAFT_322542 [Aspergillus campestris IBT 28561]